MLATHRSMNLSEQELIAVVDEAMGRPVAAGSGQTGGPKGWVLSWPVLRRA
jgi:hypothetical protein